MPVPKFYNREVISKRQKRPTEKDAKSRLNRINPFRSRGYIIKIKVRMCKWVSTGLTHEYVVRMLQSKPNPRHNEYRTRRIEAKPYYTTAWFDRQEKIDEYKSRKKRWK